MGIRKLLLASEKLNAGLEQHTSSPQQNIDSEVVSNEEGDFADDSTLLNDEPEYPKGLRLVLIVVALCMTVFLVALDSTILATVIPTITSYFGSLDDVAWYSAVYLVTTCAFQLPFGRAYAIWNTKWTYLASIIIFMIGSAVSGAAPTSVALIIGRAIAGVGGSGIVGGVFIILARNIPLRKRSLYTGFIGGTLGVASVIGPLIGELFLELSSRGIDRLSLLQGVHSQLVCLGDGVSIVCRQVR